MLRRTKSVVTLDVPPREEQIIFIPMAEAQRFWTYRVLTRLNNNELKEMLQSELKDEIAPADDGKRAVLAHLENIQQQPATANNAQSEYRASVFMKLDN
jgi:SWI/SNF-related matrix-associated actin-dependent regulator of chromatin subfamily A member 5